jgi:hypothetical protein
MPETHSSAANRDTAYVPADVDPSLSFHLNWVSVPIFLAMAIAVALYAKYVSGGWMRPWIGIKPLWWFFLLLLVPWIALPLLVVNLILRRHTPGAITGRKAPG